MLPPRMAARRSTTITWRSARSPDLADPRVWHIFGQMTDETPTASGRTLLGSRRLHRSISGIAAVTPGPPPLARMVRTGLTIATAFGTFALQGNLPAALLAAGFANLLLFVDQGGTLTVRLAVLAIGAACLIGAGAAGVLLPGSGPLLLAAALAVATAAGLIHSRFAGA